MLVSLYECVWEDEEKGESQAKKRIWHRVLSVNNAIRLKDLVVFNLFSF